MTGQGMLVRIHVGKESLGMSFENATALAVERDNMAASELRIQGKEKFCKNSPSWRWRKLKARVNFYLARVNPRASYLA